MHPPMQSPLIAYAQVCALFTSYQVMYINYLHGIVPHYTLNNNDTTICTLKYYDIVVCSHLWSLAPS